MTLEEWSFVATIVAAIVNLVLAKIGLAAYLSTRRPKLKINIDITEIDGWTSNDVIKSIDENGMDPGQGIDIPAIHIEAHNLNAFPVQATGIWIEPALKAWRSRIDRPLSAHNYDLTQDPIDAYGSSGAFIPAAAAVHVASDFQKAPWFFPYYYAVVTTVMGTRCKARLPYAFTKLVRFYRADPNRPKINGHHMFIDTVKAFVEGMRRSGIPEQLDKINRAIRTGKTD